MVDRIPSINPGGTAGQQIFARRAVFNQVASSLATAGAAAQNPQAPTPDPPPEAETDNNPQNQNLQSQPLGVRQAVQDANLQQARQDLVNQFIQDVAGPLPTPGSGEDGGNAQAAAEPQVQNAPGQTVDPQIPGQGVSDTLPPPEAPAATGGPSAPTDFEAADSSPGPAVPAVDTFSVTETATSIGGGSRLENLVRPEDVSAPAPRRPEEGISQAPGGASRGAIVDVVA